MLSAETHRGNRDAIREGSYGRFLYNRFRYYDPSIGRYISADPIGQLGALFGRGVALSGMVLPRGVTFSAALSGSDNLYMYAGNSPASHIDPSGLLWFSAGVSGGGAAGGSITKGSSSWISGSGDYGSSESSSAGIGLRSANALNSFSVGTGDSPAGTSTTVTAAYCIGVCVGVSFSYGGGAASLTLLAGVGFPPGGGVALECTETTATTEGNAASDAQNALEGWTAPRGFIRAR